MRATVESTHDNGSPRALRDEEGTLWRVAVNDYDGTMAIEMIAEGDCPIREAQTWGMAPCGVARWESDDSLSICAIPAYAHEENTDDRVYRGAYATYVPRPEGWREQ